MYKLILSNIRQKKEIYTGTFISIVLAMMLLTISWNLMFSSISGLRRGGSINYIGSISLFGTLSGITIFAAIFVIVGTTSFSIQQRYSSIALLRGIGLTPKQIKKMIASEMNLLGVFGFILGAPLGIITAPFLLNWFINLGAVPRGFVYSITFLNLIMVFAIGLLVLQLAAYFSAKRISEISPTEALRESTIRTNSTGTGKLIVGLIFILGAVAILMFVPQKGAAGIGYNFLASLCFIIGVSVLGDVIVKIISSIIRIVFKLFGATGNLASENSKLYSYRMANAALGIILIISLNGGILNNTLAFNENMLKEANSYYDDRTELFNQDGFSFEQLQDVQSLFNKDIYEVLIESEVEHYGLNGNKYKYDPKATVEKIVFSVGKTQIDKELKEFLYRWPNMSVNPGQGTTAQQDANLKTQNAVIYMMIFISLLFSSIAVINTFFITIASRKAEYRNLWLIGMTKKQINKMLNLESIIIILVGILLGGIINSACIGTFNRANGYSNSVIGNPVVFFGLIIIGFLVGFIASRISIAKEVNKSIGRVRYE